MKTILIFFTFIVPAFAVAQTGYNNFSIKSYPTHQLRPFNVNHKMDNKFASLITESNFVSSLIEKQVKELPLSNAKVNEIQKMINNNDILIYAPHSYLEKEVEYKWFVYEVLASMPGGGGGGPYQPVK